MLSAERDSRSEVLPKSKDPMLACTNMNVKRHFDRKARVEFSADSVLPYRNARSFDLKATRKRVAFGAQDDRLYVDHAEC
jgi:hypothetical protein